MSSENAWHVLDAARTFRVTPEDVRARDTVKRVNSLHLTETEFIDQYERVYQPVVISNEQLEWPATEKWMLEVHVCLLLCLFMLTDFDINCFSVNSSVGLWFCIVLHAEYVADKLIELVLVYIVLLKYCLAKIAYEDDM